MLTTQRLVLSLACTQATERLRMLLLKLNRLSTERQVLVLSCVEAQGSCIPVSLVLLRLPCQRLMLLLQLSMLGTQRREAAQGCLVLALKGSKGISVLSCRGLCDRA